MTITVNEFTKYDVPQLIEIWNNVVEDGVAFPQEELLDEKSGYEFFSAQTYTGIAKDENGNTLGLYILHPNNVGRCGHIANASYAVDAQQRGKHIGEALVRDCLEKGAKKGFRILQFNAVVRSNTAALKLYEKLGFIPLGTISGGFRNKNGVYEDIIPHYITLK